MSGGLDPRITPARPDLAAADLRDRVMADRYVEGRARQVVRDGAPLTFAPKADARLESQLLYGEAFTVFEDRDGWCWGQNQFDGYVGYVPSAALSAEVHTPTHQVAAPSLHLYSGPDMKRRTTGAISIGALVRIVDVEGGFAQLASGEWVFAKHLVDLNYFNADLVGTALKLLGTPYLWGGRSARGLDCSALLQLALLMAGERAPRDSDMLEAFAGEPVPIVDGHDFGNIEDGDMVFFPGHCGFFVHGWRFLHANAFDMEVSLHSFSDVIDRADADGAGVTSIRRFSVSDDSSELPAT